VSEDVPHVEGEEEVVEIIDGVPVVADSGGQVEPAPPAMVPARQAAALAATGFVAGAATVAAVHRRRSRALSRRKRKGRGALGEIVASNSFLVDVHLIRRD
jgi:hypothetical protein